MNEEKGFELSEDFRQAIKLLENSRETIFITGHAGTGKSTLLEYFREKTAKTVVTLAPTGVAALNVKGQTIHSFFKFHPQITRQKAKEVSAKLKKIIKKTDIIIIDEVSMLRSDLLDCIDEALRACQNPDEAFGGVQMVFIGDLYQLPPVVSQYEASGLFYSEYESPYFFDAKVIRDTNLKIIELEHIYRQSDIDFITLLNKIRNNNLDEDDMECLNARHNHDFSESDEFSITLTATNSVADELNAKKLAEINAEKSLLEGQIRGNFSDRQLPTSLNLEIKIGAQVMLLNNDQQRRWANGSIGKVIGIDIGDDLNYLLLIKLNNGNVVEIGQHTWEMHRYFYNSEIKGIDVEVVGSFKQYPVRLAWAVTIHKSQGKTFDNVVLDIGRGAFAHGQIYVALSRCRTFGGITLKKPIRRHDIRVDERVKTFFERPSRLNVQATVQQAEESRRPHVQ